MNYHTINNFGRLHLSIWIGNKWDVEKTLGAAILPNPVSGIIFLLNDILCVSFAMDASTPNTPSPGQRGNRGATQ